ncbi:MAG: Uma2 family endonuclease [Microscillaceae bacterium]|nr:Uma2 family endonuclease [Microscillaceae bacterium]
MEKDTLIDWNAEVAALNKEEKEHLKALIAFFRKNHTPTPPTVEDEDTWDQEDYAPQNTPYFEVKDHYNQQDILEIIAKFPKNKKWTFEDLQNPTYFPPDLRVKVELLDYKIYVDMDPKPLHQEILSNIHIELGMFVKKNKLGKTYVAPVSLKINDGTTLKPDILYISLSKYEFIQENCIETAPELVIEILSPSNYRKLRTRKKQKYADFGVQEYWEISPKKQQISIEVLDAKTHSFVLYSEAKASGKVHSKVLEGFALDPADVFDVE